MTSKEDKKMPIIPIIEVKNLLKKFDIRQGISKIISKSNGNNVFAVNGVTFKIQKGKTIGLIGESGCGKTTLGRCILRLQEPTSGKIYFKGNDITKLNEDKLKRFRRSNQIIFQDPYASLNPRQTVKQIVSLPLKIHEGLSIKQSHSRVENILHRVGLQSTQMQSYPHQFSGGQRQRIGIARSLILNPEFVVCDEPVSALDVSIQAQILELLIELKEDFSLTYFFISHDISVVGYIADYIMVMYLGEIVESGTKNNIINNPKHPYTKALIAAVPRVDGISKKKRNKLKFDPPSPLYPPPGCKFQTRCSEVMKTCKTVVPENFKLEGDHYVACHLYS